MKAFLLSLSIHLVALNLFFFTFPLSHPSFQPSFVFLGSILNPQDTAAGIRRGIPAGIPRSPMEGPSDHGMEKALFGEEKTGKRFGEEEGRKPDFRRIVKSGEKVVTKSLFDITLDTKSAAQDEQDSFDADYKINPYKPLGLFPDDPN